MVTVPVDRQAAMVLLAICPNPVPWPAGAVGALAGAGTSQGAGDVGDCMDNDGGSVFDPFITVWAITYGTVIR